MKGKKGGGTGVGGNKSTRVGKTGSGESRREKKRDGEKVGENSEDSRAGRK